MRLSVDFCEAVGVFAGGGEGQGDGRVCGLILMLLEFEPGAETLVANLGVAAPEFGREETFDPEVVDLQLDACGRRREVSVRILPADAKGGDRVPFALRSDDHARLPRVRNSGDCEALT